MRIIKQTGDMAQLAATLPGTHEAVGLTQYHINQEWGAYAY